MESFDEYSKITDKFGTAVYSLGRELVLNHWCELMGSEHLHIPISETHQPIS